MALQVVLDRGLYASGETVKGKFTINLKEKQKIRAVKVRLKGVEKSERTMTTEHSEKIVNETKVVFGKAKDDKKDLFLDPGVHEFPFDFVLPPIAPSSFHQVAIALEKDQSKIKYTVKGFLDIPMGIDKKAKASFLVHHHIDPKVLLENMDPKVVSETEKMNSGLFGVFKNGSVKVSAHMPKTCFCLGEKFQFKVSVENKSGRELQKVETQLHRVIDIQHRQRVERYNSELDPTYPKVVCVSHATKDENVTADKIDYQIPGAKNLRYLSTAGSTQHIYIDYAMHVVAHFDGIGGEVKLKVPVIIHDSCCIQAGVAAGVLKGAPVAAGPVAPAVHDPFQTLTNTMAATSLQTFASPQNAQLPTMPVMYPGMMYNPHDAAAMQSMQSMQSLSTMQPNTHANTQNPQQGSMQTLTNTMAPNPAMQTMQPMMYNPSMQTMQPMMMMQPHPAMMQHSGSMQTLTATQNPHTPPPQQQQGANANATNTNSSGNMQTLQATMQPGQQNANSMASMQTMYAPQGYHPQVMMYPQGMYPAQPGMVPYGQYPMMYHPQAGGYAAAGQPGMMPMMYMQPQQQQQAAQGTPPPQQPPASPQPKK